MNPPIKTLNAPLLITLTVVGGFVSLVALGYGKAYVQPAVHAVFQQPTGEPDMDAPTPPKASAKEVDRFFKRVAREAKAHEDAATVANLFGPATDEEIAIASDQVTPKPQQHTKLLGHYTRPGSLRYEYAEAR